MTEQGETPRFYFDFDRLPKQFPTHRHDPIFWEALGRAVATFGFLEETLGRAIFAFTATRKYPENEIAVAYKTWLRTLERALTDPLGKLISSYELAVSEHPDSKTDDDSLKALVEDLRESSRLRNALCHASWQAPDEKGKSLPRFIDRDMMVIETPIDIDFLKQTQEHIAELACVVMNTVTQMGLQFPGSNGPGIPIMGGDA